MPTVRFTANLRRHVETPELSVAGSTVAEALAAVFERSPAVRGYVLDDQGGLRKHMNVFVDGEQIVDRVGLSDRVMAEASIWVIQALSGG